MSIVGHEKARRSHTRLLVLAHSFALDTHGSVGKACSRCFRSICSDLVANTVVNVHVVNAYVVNAYVVNAAPVADIRRLMPRSLQMAPAAAPDLTRPIKIELTVEQLRENCLIAFSQKERKRDEERRRERKRDESRPRERASSNRRSRRERLASRLPQSQSRFSGTQSMHLHARGGG